MEFKSLLKKLKSYMDSDAEQLQKEDEGLSKVLKKLKQEEAKIKQQIATKIDDEERDQLQQELNIVHSQRKKGIALLSELRKKARG